MRIAMAGLTKVYGGGVRALDGVDLTIETGMFGLLGPNGAGKTTLMRILAGILRPTSGHVDAGGHDLTGDAGRTAIKQMLGYLPQELGLYPDLTAREFLDYIGVLKGMDAGKARRARVDELIETVGLADAAQRKLKTFSGGMKRRVGIAQALLNDPRLLIVDEPTAGLDPEERIRFRILIAGLSADRTVLLSTHIVEDVAQTCRNLAVLAAGRVLFAGTLNDLIEMARGYVWQATLPADLRAGPPTGDLDIVSVLHLGGAVQYRVVGERPRNAEAVPLEPSLEDGYLRLMRMQRERAVGA